MIALAFQLAGSLLAIGALVLLVRRLERSGPQAQLDEAEALRLARLAPAGFEPVAAALSVDRRRAVCRDAQGARMLVSAHGARFVTMRLPADCADGCDGALHR